MDASYELRMSLAGRRHFYPLSILLAPVLLLALISAALPSSLPELSGVKILYFSRAADKGAVSRGLQAGNIGFDTEPSNDARASNVVTCTPDVSPAAVRKVALLALQGGAQIRGIAPSVYPSKKGLITIEAYEGLDGDPLLTPEQILALPACPTKIGVAYPALTDFWVAAHDVGSSSSFFRRGPSEPLGSVIKVGQNLVSDRALNVREAPADWSHTIGVLPKGAKISAAELRWITVVKTGQQQLWVRIVSPETGTATKLALTSDTAAPSRSTVDACLRAGYQTASEMFACSGGMFTPELLSSCLLGGNCGLGMPAYAFDGVLEASGRTWSQPLTLTAPRLDPDKTIACTASADPEKFKQCASTQAIPQPDASSCDSISLDPDAVGKCIVDRLPNPWNYVAGCLMGEMREDPVACFKPIAPDLANEVASIDACVRQAGAQIDWHSALCLISQLPGDYGRIAHCLEPHTFSDPLLKLQCAYPIPMISRAARVVSCADDSKSAADLVRSCLPAVETTLPSNVESCLQAQATDLISCLASANVPGIDCFKNYAGQSLPFLSCLISGDTALAQEVRIVQCLINSKEPSDFVAACLPLDDRIRIPAACALRQTDRAGLIGCAGAAFLDGQERRILACAVSSQSYFEFGVCLSGLRMNNEVATLVRCAGESGGEPHVAAVCTVGLWTMNELEKCQKSIGGADGCFGPNNTIVKYLVDLNEALQSGPIPPATILLASIQTAKAVSDGFAANVNNLKGSINACIANPDSCPSQAIDYCQNNKIICGVLMPVSANPILHLFPQIPSPPPLPFFDPRNVRIPSL